ncbi:hypothetical protein BGW42_001635 [Actinomortierella wolfii]|nr:hypothetical protein BGW42_001635 [Actinomortierella wolfii]
MNDDTSGTTAHVASDQGRSKPRYESIQEPPRENEESLDPSFAATNQAWSELTRRASDMSAAEYDIAPSEERIALTTRPSMPATIDSRDHLLRSSRDAFSPGSDPSLEEEGRLPPIPSSSSSSGEGALESSSLAQHPPKQGSTASAAMESVREALGRASTRVVNLRGARSRIDRKPLGARKASSSPPPPLPRTTATPQPQPQPQSAPSSAPAPSDIIPSAESKAEVNNPPSTSPPPSSTLRQPTRTLSTDPWANQSPLEGHSLFIFGPESKLRQSLYNILNQRLCTLELGLVAV